MEQRALRLSRMTSDAQASLPVDQEMNLPACLLCQHPLLCPGLLTPLASFALVLPSLQTAPTPLH